MRDRRQACATSRSLRVWQRLSAFTLLTALGLTGVPSAIASAPQVTLQRDTAPPGATVVLTGKGLGEFKSVRFNRVTVAGRPALIQRWESDRIEVRVPSNATTGPVQVEIGRKLLAVGTLTVVKPTIDSITPTEAERGTLLTISGRHFGVTAGGRDPNTMFGVNDVMIGDAVVRAQRWTDTSIEVPIPAHAVSGDVVVRLASFDPLPDGSCCAPVEYVVSNARPLSLRGIHLPTDGVAAGPVADGAGAGVQRHLDAVAGVVHRAAYFGEIPGRAEVLGPHLGVRLESPLARTTASAFSSRVVPP